MSLMAVPAADFRFLVKLHDTDVLDALLYPSHVYAASGVKVGVSLAAVEDGTRVCVALVDGTRGEIDLACATARAKAENPPAPDEMDRIIDRVLFEDYGGAEDVAIDIAALIEEKNRGASGRAS